MMMESGLERRSQAELREEQGSRQSGSCFKFGVSLKMLRARSRPFSTWVPRFGNVRDAFKMLEKQLISTTNVQIIKHGLSKLSCMPFSCNHISSEC